MGLLDKIRASKASKKAKTVSDKKTRSAEAAKFREGKANERTKATKAMKDRQGANTYKSGEPLGTPKKATKRKSTSAYSSDTRSPKQVESGNKRAISNRTNKGKVKVGEDYIFTDKNNKKQTAKKKK
jgi:hypothetical protein